MKAFQMNLSSRLRTGFGLVLALLLLVTLLALHCMERMNENLRDIVEVHNQRTGQSQAMMNAINAMSISIVSLGTAQDAEDVKYNIAEVSKAFQQYDVSRRAFGELLKDGASGSPAEVQLKTIDGIDAEARANIDSLRKMAESSTPKDVGDALNTINPRRAQDLWLKEIIGQIQLETNSALQSYESARASFRSARAVLIAATAAALIVGLAAASLILRSVTRPLNSAVDHA